MSEGELFDTPPENGVEKSAPVAAAAVEPAAKSAEVKSAAAPVEVRKIPMTRPAASLPGQRLPRGGSLGATLSALRRRSGMELDEVAEVTRIKRGYLEALENEDFSSLPQTIYVLAYVKKLCEVYALDREGVDELVAGLREQLSYEIPEDIDKSVVCREQDEATHRKLRRITIGIAAGVVMVLALLALGGTLLLAGLRPGGAPAEPALSEVDDNRLLQIQGKPELRLSLIQN